MAVANASLYDGASATAEAAAMACAAPKKQKCWFPLRYIRNTAKYCRPMPMVLVCKWYRCLIERELQNLTALEKLCTDEVAAFIIQQPSFFGNIEDLTAAAELIHQIKGLLVAVVDPVAMALLASPGSCGADIVVGEGQGLGIPMNFGGPHLGFMACTEKLLRACLAGLWVKPQIIGARGVLC